MMENLKLANASIATIGEEIGLDLGNSMISQYQAKNPTDVIAYEIGRNIIDQILAQPGCVGLKFYNAENELGEKTLVYVGLSTNGTDITKIVEINVEGELTEKNGIVADRIKVIRDPGTSSVADSDDWEWTID